MIGQDERKQVDTSTYTKRNLCELDNSSQVKEGKVLVNVVCVTNSHMMSRWLTAVNLYSHETDGVRKEKERLTATFTLGHTVNLVIK